MKWALKDRSLLPLPPRCQPVPFHLMQYTSHFTQVFLQHSLVSHNAWLHPRYSAPAGKHPQKEPGYTDEQTQCFDKSGPPECEQKH